MSTPFHPPFLGDLEMAVMDHLWAGSDADAKAVHRAVGRERGITLNTIQSTLKRLYEKGLLQREKVSHAHTYSPCTTREEFHRQALQEVIDRVMGGEADAMLSAFIGVAERVGPEQLEQLEQLVAERLKGHRNEEGVE